MAEQTKLQLRVEWSHYTTVSPCTAATQLQNPHRTGLW